MKCYLLSAITPGRSVLRIGLIPATLFLLGGGFAASALRAQAATVPAAAAEETVVLDPFRVSTENDVGYGSGQTTIGNRMTKPVGDIPSAIYIANQQMLKDMAADRSYEVMRFAVAGASETNEINDDSNFRGFRSPYQMRDNILFTTNRQSPMYDVDRVEFLKGPAAMVLGNIAYVGGIANYVTKEPTSTLQGAVSVGVQDEGSRAILRGQLDQSGPLASRKDYSVGYRVTLAGQDGKQPKDDQWTRQFFAGGGLLFKFFHGRVSLDLKGFYWVNNDVDYYNDFLDLTTSPLVPAGRNLPTAHLNPLSTRSFSFAGGAQIGPSQYENTRTKYGQALLSTQFTDNSFLRLSYTGSNYTDRRRLMRAISLAADNVTLSMQDLGQAYDYPSQTLQADYLYRTVTKWGTNEFQAGGEGDWTKNATGTFIIPAPVTMNAANPAAFYNAYTPTPYPLTINSFKTLPSGSYTSAVTTGGSYFIQDNVSTWNDKLIFVGGFRWVDSLVNTENLLTGAQSATDNPRIRTYRFGAVFKPVDHLSLYYVTMDNVSPNPGLDSNNVPFVPSFGKDNEYGLKADWGNSRVHLYGTFAYFRMVLTNVKVSFADPTAPGGIRLAQVASNGSKGWESQWGARLNTDGGHADVIINYENVDTVAAPDGGYAAEAPRWVESLFGTYTFTVAPIKGLTVGGGMYHQGAKRTGGTFLVKQPPLYSLLARYDFAQHWSVQANGDNITNEYYIDSIATTGLVLTGHSAQYRLSATYKW